MSDRHDEISLYRINFIGDIKLNMYTKILIENGQLEAIVGEDHEIKCEACGGHGYDVGSLMPALFRPKCERCSGVGVRIARIVIMEEQ